MTLGDVRDKVAKLAAVIGLRDPHLPTFGTSEDGGRAHVEVEGSLYHFVIRERGSERERLTFTDEEELLYRLFERATAHASSDWETAHRTNHNVDSRREVFRKQQESMDQLSLNWGDRLAREQAAVLRNHPFDDATNQRANLCPESTMVNDYFEQSRRLAAELQRCGHEADGQALIDAIECGSIGTEIHMALQYHLRRVSEIQPLDPRLRAAAHQLALEVTKALDR